MRPTTEPSTREIFRAILLDHLFIPQREYWKTKLQSFIDTNRIYHGKRLNHPYGIHYLNQNWEGNRENEWGEDTIFLSLHPEILDKEKEILEIVGQLSELEAEEYEVNRFLSGLILFSAPFEIFERVLGKQLSEEIRASILAVKPDLLEIHETRNPWDDNSKRALMTYVDQHEYVLKAMNQRLVINLITRDQIRQ